RMPAVSVRPPQMKASTMTTKAGRFSSTISHGSPRRSTIRTRPMTRPIAVPASIATLKAQATRANVTPSWTNNSPVRAWATTTAITRSGPGSICGPANSEAIHHTARNKISETRRCIGSIAGRTVEGAGHELLGWSDQRLAAQAGENAVKQRGVLLLGRDRPVGDALAVAVAVGLQRGGVCGAGQRRDAVPLGVGGHQDLLGPMRHIEEGRDVARMRLGEGFAEHIADHGQVRRNAELRQQVADADEPAEAVGLEAGAEIPVIQRRVHLALLHLG